MEGPALLGALDESWGATSALLAELGDDIWDRSTGCPGWTVKDQLAHLVWSARLLAGQQPAEIDLPDLEHVHGPIGEYMELDVEARRARAGSEVLAEFDNERVRAIDRGRHLLTDGATFSGPMRTEMPLARYLPIAVFDQWLHGEDIRAALELDGDWRSAAAIHSFGQIERGIAAKATDGAVEFVCTGPIERRLVVGDGEPTATVTIPLEDLLTLAGGRDRPMSVPVITGDTAAAHAVIEGFPLTP